jgi:hypothetical protein
MRVALLLVAALVVLDLLGFVTPHSLFAVLHRR